MRARPRPHAPRAVQRQLEHPPAGRPLPAEARAAAPAHGHDFADVRVHADAQAAALAQALDAHAFTVGPDIYFGDGAFAPGTPYGDAVLRHELVHVVQAREGRADAAPGPDGLRVSEAGDAQEAEAHGGAPAPAGAAPAGAVVVQRLGLWDDLVGGAQGLATDAKGLWAQEQAWEQSNRSPFQQFNQMVTGGLGELTDLADTGLASWVASTEDGPAPLNYLATGTSALASGGMHIGSGIVEGAAHLVSGLGQMASTPLSTLSGLGSLGLRAAEAIPGLGSPLRAMHAEYNLMQSDHSPEAYQAYADYMNPLSQLQDAGRLGSDLVGGMLHPIMEHVEKGEYGEALGRGAFEALLMLGTGGGGEAASAGRMGAEAASEVALREAAVGAGEGIAGEAAALLDEAELASFEELRTADVPGIGRPSPATPEVDLWNEPTYVGPRPTAPTTVEMPAVTQELETVTQQMPAITREMPAVTQEMPAITREMEAVAAEAEAATTEGAAIDLDATELESWETAKTGEYSAFDRQVLAKLDKNIGLRDAAADFASDPRFRQENYAQLSQEGRLELATDMKDSIQRRFNTSGTMSNGAEVDPEIVNLPGGRGRNGVARTGRNEIGVNVDTSTKLQTPGGLANTLSHEFEHFMQRYFGDNPDLAIDPAAAREMAANQANYIPSKVDYAAYRAQPMEVGARAAGDTFEQGIAGARAAEDASLMDEVMRNLRGMIKI